MKELETIDSLLTLNGKVAFVTGAAMGIGQAIVRRLHQAGAMVIVSDLNRDAADTLANELNELRAGSAHSFGLDVSRASEVEAAFAYTLEKCGSLDILVNNAGIYPFQNVMDMNEADFMRVIDVNLKGVFLCTQNAATAMNDGGKIINITSIDAIHPSMAGLAHYDASKHGVWGFTKNIALELAERNITVNAIAPGAIATPGVGSIDGEIPDTLKAMEARIPMKRIGQGDDIAKATLFLASDLSSYMTGSQIVVDGGLLLK
ncbi:MAG: SDR family NAD(P)-dependent oxidoreductase [Candidatus Microsaccharimonas sp.]